MCGAAFCGRSRGSGGDAPPPASRSRSPEYSASCFSKIFVYWMSSLISLGNARALVETDLHELGGDDDVKTNCDAFESAVLARAAAGEKDPIRAAVFSTFRSRLFASGLLQLLLVAAQAAPAPLLNGLLKSLSDPATPAWEPFVWSVALFLQSVSKTLIDNALQRHLARSGFRVRAMVSAAVYRKALRVSPSAQKQTSTGKVLNLMQQDAASVESLLLSIHSTWSSPLLVVVYMVLLGFFVSYACLAGLAFILLLVPCQFGAMSRVTARRKEIAVASDARIKATQEVLVGVRAIKQQNWEAAFEGLVGAKRGVEMDAIWAYSKWNAVLGAVAFIAPLFVGLITILVFAAIAAPGQFTPSAIFSALSVLNQLRFPVMMLPGVMAAWANANVAIQRLSSFILALEVVPMRASEPSGGSGGGAEGGADAGVAIRIKAGTFRHDKAGGSDGAAGRGGSGKGGKGGEAKAPPPSASSAQAPPPASSSKSDTKPATASSTSPAPSTGPDATAAAAPVPPPPLALSAVELSIPKGQLWAVIGPVGSGKSSLCNAILGEIDCQAGSVRVNGSTSYVSQSVWVVNGSVRNNVTFAGDALHPERPAGEAEARYKEVMRVCHLEHDVATFDAGDKTEIGEKGINLSGGQKQRIAIARVAYADTDIAIFDDPLSALDAEVAQALFTDCFTRFLKGKTRLVITNNLQFLPLCDGIIMVGGGAGDPNGGRIVAQGSFDDLMAREPAFAALMTDYGFKVMEQLGGADEATPTLNADVATASSPAGAADSSTAAPTAPTASVALPSAEPLAAAVAAVTARPALLQTDVAGVDESRPADKAAAAAPPQTPSAAELKALLLRAASMRSASPVPALPSAGHVGFHASAATPAPSTTVSIAPAKVAAAGEGKPPHAAADAATAVVVRVASGRRGKLMTVETKDTGAVKCGLYMGYVSAAGCVGWFLLCLLLSTLLCAQLGNLGSSYWMSYWSAQVNAVVPTTKPMGFYMGIYAGIVSASGVFALSRSLLLACISIRVSRKLHGDLFRSVVRSPVVFFDTTPLGRIITRFSRDFQLLDQALPESISFALMMSLMVLFALAAVIIQSAWFAIALIPIGAVYYYFMVIYSTVAREVKRFSSLAASPVYAHFSETLVGVQSIRAYRLQERFSRTNSDLLNALVSTDYTTRFVALWLGIRLEAIGAFITLVCALLASGTFVASGGSVEQAGLSGFALNFSMLITGMLNMVIQALTTVEQNFNSVERIQEYVKELGEKSEPYEVPPAPRQLVTPPASWPAHGSIEFKDLHMRYRSSTRFILRGLSFAVAAGERIGIVGRTGAGKSSIMQALFRTVVEKEGNAEDCNVSGDVFIDGVPIHSLPLNTLRRALAIIPQDPVLFSGSVRSNLDPLAAAADADLWRVIESVGLRDAIRALPGGLDAEIAEGASNVSAGQRQLICIARALHRESKVVLLDEASSSLDHTSDALIQRAVREQFRGATMLVIAHRLGTIIDSDRVLVMDDGHVGEFDHPHALLQTPHSIFASLVEEMGPEMAAELKAQAKATWEQRGKADAGAGPKV